MRGVIVAASALKRGHREDDILHALRNHADEFGLDEGVTMIVGPAYSGTLLEVGFIRSDDDALVVIHCMDVRSKFLR